MKYEVRSAVDKQIKQTRIVNKMFTTSGDFRINKITEVINEMYDSGNIPEDPSKSIFIPLPKKPGANKCELRRTISLISHITKLMI